MSTESAASVSSQQKESRQLGRVLLMGGAARLAVFMVFPGLISRYIADRVELTTPVSSYTRIVEGAHLFAHGISPYDGGIFHQSPILLVLFSILRLFPTHLATAATAMVYVVADLLVALFLAQLARIRNRTAESNTPKIPGEHTFACKPATVAMLYLFNPLTIAAVLARSPSVFSHLAVVAALLAASRRQSVRAAIFTAIAAHLSLYPALLAFPISLLATKDRKQNAMVIAQTFGICMAVFLALHLLFTGIFGTHYFSATFGFALRVADLQPNVGLFWYFFTEIFDEFRAFYITVFHLSALAFAVPVTWRFRKDPLFAAAFLTGIISTVKAYPSWADLSLFLGTLPLFEPLLKYMRYTFLAGNLIVYGVVLAPVFWYLWIEQGSGNANFFYAATLVYGFGQITLLFDLGSAMLRRDLDQHHPETRESAVIQQ